MNALHYIFVVGCQRSGTTLLGQILGAHPQAVLIDENHRVYDLIEAILSASGNEEEALQQSLRMAHRMYAERSRFTAPGILSPSVTHVVFKAPNTTYDYQRLRTTHHPHMHFVFAVRDARDVVCSMQRLFHIPMVENQLNHLARYEHPSTRFADDLKRIQHPDTADHLRQALIWKVKSSLYAEFTRAPLNAFLIRYEDLVSAPNHWIPRLLDHVNLDAHSDAPLHHEEVFGGMGPGFTIRTREIDTIALRRWKRQLTTDQEQDIWHVAGGLMHELGYPRRLAARGEPGAWIAHNVLAQPVVATGRGGSGTRLLSLALQEHNVFLGNRFNRRCQDSIEWVDLIYELVLKKLLGRLPSSPWWRRELNARAGYILAKGHWKSTQGWGWKLPETMLIVPEVAQAFTDAKIIHLVRHPFGACLRRSHVTSRMNHSIGAATLHTAYRWLDWDRDPLDDADHIRNAASWVYQVDQVARFGRRLGAERYLEIKYEDLCIDPQTVSDRIATFLGNPTVSTHLHAVIDHTKRRPWAEDDARAPEVWSICETTATALGYRLPPY